MVPPIREQSALCLRNGDSVSVVAEIMLIGRSDASLRDTMHRSIAKAELPIWANLWRSLRSTRQTELENAGFPTHVVCYWLGNSPKVANKHYLKVVDENYAKATAKAG